MLTNSGPVLSFAVFFIVGAVLLQRDYQIATKSNVVFVTYCITVGQSYVKMSKHVLILSSEHLLAAGTCKVVPYIQCAKNVTKRKQGKKLYFRSESAALSLYH
jgi:hypothetical protein